MNEEKPSLKVQMVSSMGAASLAEGITIPLDTIKTNMQAHLHREQPLRESVRSIYRAHGLGGFYRSWFPSMTRQACATGLRLGMYGYINDRWGGLEKKFWGGSFVQGAACGLVSNIAAMPMDVVKTRIQSAQGTPEATTFRPMAQRIWSESGFRGYYRGFWQTAQRSMLISSVQLPVYFGIQEKLKETEWVEQNLSLSARTSLASLATTLSVTMVVYPVDLCKTQVQSNLNQSRSTVKVMAQVVRQDGILTLYRGFWVGLGRSLPQFWLTSLFYENIKSWMLTEKVLH